jgi:hypothetical protein
MVKAVRLKRIGIFPAIVTFHIITAGMHHHVPTNTFVRNHHIPIATKPHPHPISLFCHAT